MECPRLYLLLLLEARLAKVGFPSAVLPPLEQLGKHLPLMLGFRFPRLWGGLETLDNVGRVADLVEQMYNQDI